MSFFRGLVKVFASILVVCSLFPCVASATESSMTSRGDSLFDASRAALAGQQLAALSSGDVQAVQASCSHLHTAAVLSDGSLWIWGSVLHLDGFGFSSYNNCTPTKIMDGVSQVSLGQTAGAAVKSNGELWMWGDHNLADYATSSTLDSSGQYVYSSNTLTKVMDGVIQAECSCNADPSFAVLKSDGSLWMWGNNDCGQLGIGSKSRQYAPVKVMDNVSSVSLGECNSAAVKTDGSLWMWGANDNGQLGTGIVDEGTVTPVNVMGGVKEVSLGDGYAAAISSDNSLWWWGCYPHLGGGGSSNSIPESGTASNFLPQGFLQVFLMLAWPGQALCS